MIAHNPNNFYGNLAMKTKIHVLPLIDYRTFRAGLATDKSQTDCTDPLPHFSPVIRSFEKLALGRYFWFILDFVEERHCGSGGCVEHLTPFTHQVFSSLPQLKLHEVTHPEDLYKVLAFSRFYIDLYDRNGLEAMLDFKMSLTFRMLNALGKYYWILVQYPDVIFDDNNRIVYGLVLVTDISHIKNHGEAMMNIFSRNEQSYQQYFCLNRNTITETEFIFPPVTQREKEILLLLTEGHSSKQIASLLHISTKTVDNHRQNMLHRTGSKSSSELVSMGIRLGMV